MIRKAIIISAAVIGAMQSVEASANDWDRAPKYPGVVSEFERICVSGDLIVAAREAAIAAAGWQPASADSIDVDAFQITGALEINFDFRKPDALRVWTKTVDGTTATVVLASYPEKRRYQTLCGMMVADAGGAIAYYDELKAVLKAKGVNGKNTDLPHYFEWASKLGAEKNPVRAEILSRSHVLGGARDMHLYIAF